MLITHGIGGRRAAVASLELKGRLEMDSAKRAIVVRIGERAENIGPETTHDKLSCRCQFAVM